MGRRHGTAFHVVQKRQDGDGKGRAFRRVRAGAQLVEEAEGAAVSLFQDGDDVRHVGGKGTEALLDALFVTDVGKNLFKNG